MPYSMPSPDDIPPIKLRPKHQRSRSSHPTFSDEHGDGAFSSLPRLPRRKSASSSTTPAPSSSQSTSNGRDKKTLFHFSDEQDSDSDDNSQQPSTTTTTTAPSNSLGLSLDLSHLSPPPTITNATSTLPFPSKLSPSHSPTPSPISSPLVRTPSTPVILLSNGKPLKPSLKSSYSSPHIPGIRVHTRARSEPATPSASTPTIKNVHFAERDALQSVRLFDRSSKPANVSKPNPLADETETETEYDSSANNGGTRNNNGEGSTYPFPVMSSVSTPATPDSTFQVDMQTSSPVPALNPPEYANLHLESIVLPPTRPVALKGNVLVRNVAFAKDVVVRFTLDDWQTTSEVTCKYLSSIPELPTPFRKPISNLGDLAAATAAGGVSDKTDDESKLAWDRFAFSIRLEDFERKLAEKTLWMVIRFTSPGMGEWWDNNHGQNYCVSFKRMIPVVAEQSGVNANTGAVVSQPEEVVVQGSQQRTFSAPPSLKRTPMTGTITPPDVVEQGMSMPKIKLTSSPLYSPSSSSARPFLPRSHSSPHPIVGGHQTLRNGSVVSPPQSKKLSLLNYAAPTPVTPPLTPPISSSSSRSLQQQSSPLSPSSVGGGGGGVLKAAASTAVDVISVSGNAGAKPASLIGGMPATAPRDDIEWPVIPGESTEIVAIPISIPDSSVSASTSAPVSLVSSSSLPSPPFAAINPGSPKSSPPTTRALLTSSEELLQQQRQQELMAYGLSPSSSSALTSDSSYTALVKQWCFVQSPTPSPPGNINVSSSPLSLSLGRGSSSSSSNGASGGGRGGAVGASHVREIDTTYMHNINGRGHYKKYDSNSNNNNNNGNNNRWLGFGHGPESLGLYGHGGPGGSLRSESPILAGFRA